MHGLHKKQNQQGEKEEGSVREAAARPDYGLSLRAFNFTLSKDTRGGTSLVA